MTALPPKPHNFFPLRFAPPVPVSAAERHAMIEFNAYLRAQSRDFAPGHELEDWVAAEMEIDQRLAQMRKLAGVQVE